MFRDLFTHKSHIKVMWGKRNTDYFAREETGFPTLPSVSLTLFNLFTLSVLDQVADLIYFACIV